MIMASTTCASFVQYVVIRRDLLSVLKWPTGAVIAQACHACTAVLHQFRDDHNVREYTANLDGMHKVVLETKNEDALRALSAELATNNIDHKLWIEQPEDCATCIAVKPHPKEQVSKYFKKLQLFK